MYCSCVNGEDVMVPVLAMKKKWVLDIVVILESEWTSCTVERRLSELHSSEHIG